MIAGMLDILWLQNRQFRLTHLRKFVSQGKHADAGLVDGCPRRCLAFTMLGTLGELSLSALVFSDFLIKGAHELKVP